MPQRKTQITKNNLTTAHNSLTVEAVTKEFLRKKQNSNLSPQTLRGYNNILRVFSETVGKETPISEIDILTIDEYQEQLVKKGIASATQASYLRHIRAFVNYAVKRGYMDKIDIEMPKVEATVKEPYTKEELERLVARPKTRNWVEWRCWAMVNYFVGTGQRLSSALEVRVSDINFQEKKVLLRHNKDRIQKWMPLSTALVRVLKEYIELSDLRDDDYLFPDNEGGKLSVRGCEDAIIDYNHSRKVDKTSIHLFRNTFAKEYIMAGGNPAKLQKLLNHKTIYMTMHYVNLYGNDLVDEFDIYNPLDNLTGGKRKRKSI